MERKAKARRAILFTLAIMMVLALVSVFIVSRNSYVVMVEKERISDKLYRYALLIAKEDALAKYPNMKEENVWNYKKDKNSPTYASEIEEYELNKLIRTAVINQQFKKLGLELTKEQDELREKNLAKRIEAYGGMKQAEKEFSKYHITYKDFVGFYEDYDRYELLFLHHFGVDGETPVSFAEIDNYCAKNYARVKSVYIPIVDASGNKLTDEELSDAKALANKVENQALLGNDFDELIRLYNKDENMTANGYLISKRYNTIPKYRETAFSMSVGEVKRIQDTDGYYIVKKYPTLESSMYTAADRQTALLEMKAKDFDNIIEKAKKTLDIKRNEVLLKKITIEKVTYR